MSNGKKLLQLADFGIGQIHEATKSMAPTQKGDGYAPYMARELLGGLPYSNKVDVWSTGCVLFEMANLKKMWYNAPDHHVFPHAIWFKVYSSIENRAHEPFDNDCPKEIKEMVSKATSNDPKERPTSQELYNLVKDIKIRL